MFATPDKTYRPHSAHDVYHVAFLLRQVLVPDLIPPILDLAEYWTRTCYDRRDPQSCVEYTAGKPYLIAVVGGGVGPRMVRRVEFSITSHDQGWSSYAQWHGTYEGSWTWFEAEVRLAGGTAAEAVDCVRRRLSTNVHAEKRNRTHVVEWRYDEEDEESRSLVRSLVGASVISIVPWARFMGWENHVSCASIEIYSAAVRRL